MLLFLLSTIYFTIAHTNKSYMIESCKVINTIWGGKFLLKSYINSLEERITVVARYRTRDCLLGPPCKDAFLWDRKVWSLFNNFSDFSVASQFLPYSRLAPCFPPLIFWSFIIYWIFFRMEKTDCFHRQWLVSNFNFNSCVCSDFVFICTNNWAS